MSGQYPDNVRIKYGHAQDNVRIKYGHAQDNVRINPARAKVIGKVSIQDSGIQGKDRTGPHPEFCLLICLLVCLLACLLICLLVCLLILAVCFQGFSIQGKLQG